MKVLYVAPENVTGGFSLFRDGHKRRGNECRWVTFFYNEFGFPEDLCFYLRAMPTRNWVKRLRGAASTVGRVSSDSYLEGNPPFWKPRSLAEAAWFRFRDVLNGSKIRQGIVNWGLDDYDIYHFEQGIDPYRDGRWVRTLRRRGKGIVCFYHGTDLRNRGAIKAVHDSAHINLTSEIDLLHRIPGMKYLYLPLDTDKICPNPRKPDGRIRIGHAARNRKMKGSDHIESVVKGLADKYPVDWVMIENIPHREAVALKENCDIFVDQISDIGGWGYGASSVESLALGIATVTRINERVSEFLGEHPFINAEYDTLKSVLVKLIENAELRQAAAENGRKWVIERHGVDSVMDVLYSYYKEADLL